MAIMEQVKRLPRRLPKLPIPEAAARWLMRLLFWASPLIAFALVECLNYANVFTDLNRTQILFNLPFYYIPLLLFYFLRGQRADRAIRWSLGLCWGVGMVNRYLLRFRGRALFPADLLTLRTAVNVAGSYDYRFDAIQWATFGVVALVFLAAAILPIDRERRPFTRRTLALALPAAALSAGFLYLFIFTGLTRDYGLATDLWTTRGNGFVLNFSLCMKDFRVSRPEGYSSAAVGALANSVTVPEAEGEQPVNVIVVMNESFSDLTVLPGVETNQDAIPFLRSLTENTVSGYAYASVFGGTTANSEYEFLTGNTTAFLPAGAVPYQMYVGGKSTSMVGQMNALGYRSVAMHPFYSSGWNRPAVYGNFGFDRALFFGDFQNPAWVRDYVSDRSNYENLVRVYEEKEPGERLFIFNVTMQNHSAYNTDWINLERDTWAVGKYENRFATVDQYLSLMRESDRALEYLINYFARVDEPTVVCIFGDHQPQVATNFYTEVLGTAPDTALAEKKQMVPFMIWANYDIEERSGVELSLNYLSTLLMETANLPQTGYQSYLGALWEEFPVVNTVGILDKDGTWYRSIDALPPERQEVLEEYQHLIYSNLFDTGHRPEGFFTLK